MGNPLHLYAKELKLQYDVENSRSLKDYLFLACIFEKLLQIPWRQTEPKLIAPSHRYRCEEGKIQDTSPTWHTESQMRRPLSNGANPLFT